VWRIFLDLIAVDCGNELSQREKNLLAASLMSTNLLGYDGLGLADTVQSHTASLSLHGCNPYSAIPSAAEWVLVNAIANGWVMPQDFWASTEGSCEQQTSIGENHTAFIHHCMLEAVRSNRKCALDLSRMLEDHNDFDRSSFKSAR
jgi:hypothetical protein